MRPFFDSLWIAFGAAIGANMRYWIGFFTKASTQTFPWPTMLINIVGSAMLGAFSAAALIKGWGGQSRLFFAVGVCGGFTTFSTFSFELIDTYYQRSLKVAAIYALASLILSIGGCLLGAHLARIALNAAPAPQSNPFRDK